MLNNPLIVWQHSGQLHQQTCSEALREPVQPPTEALRLLYGGSARAVHEV